jgi:hypothetical protein
MIPAMGEPRTQGMLPWSWAQERLESATRYWLTPTWAFGLVEAQFASSPTRWEF